MKPKLINIFIDGFPGSLKAIRLDFDNDRHHMSRLIGGDRDEIADVLYSLALQIKQDGHLDGVNTGPTDA